MNAEYWVKNNQAKMLPEIYPSIRTRFYFQEWSLKKKKEEEAGFGRTIWQPWPPVWRKQVGILGCESYESPFSQSQLTSCPHGWVVYYKNWREEPRNPGTDSNRHVQHNTYTTMGMPQNTHFCTTIDWGLHNCSNTHTHTHLTLKTSGWWDV